MESLLKYRMENLDWIDRFLEKLGVDAFLEFETRVYSALDKLKVMHYYDIGGSVIPEQQELFIKFCCCYITGHSESNSMKTIHRYGGKKAMNNGRWQPDEDRYVRENVNKKTLEQMAEHLGRSALAVQLYMHRKHIVVGQTVKRNLVQEILRLKFRHPENFMPNRAFYQEVGINQMRWWDIFYGRKNINQEEYIALSKYFDITLEEAFAARQLCIFEEQ